MKTDIIHSELQSINIFFFISTGQQVIRLPDGRLQLITIPQQKVQQQQGNVVQAVAITTQTATPARTLQVQAAGQGTALRPQTVVVNSAGTPVSLSPNVSGVTPTKIVVGSQPSVAAAGVQSALIVSSQQASTATAGTISIMTSSGPGIARIISPVKGGTAAQVIQKVGGSVMAVTNTPQGPRIIRQITGTPQIVVQGQQQQAQPQQQALQLKQQQLQQHQQILAQQQATLKAVQQQQQIKLPTGQIIQVAAGAGQTITLTPQQLAALQQQQSLKQIKPAETTTQVTTVSAESKSAIAQTSDSFQDQFVKQVQQTTTDATTGQTQTSIKSPVPGSPPPVVSPTSKPPTDVTSQNKYAVTPQVVQEGNFEVFLFCSIETLMIITFCLVHFDTFVKKHMSVFLDWP